MYEKGVTGQTRVSHKYCHRIATNKLHITLPYLYMVCLITVDSLTANILHVSQVFGTLIKKKNALPTLDLSNLCHFIKKLIDVVSLKKFIGLILIFQLL